MRLRARQQTSYQDVLVAKAVEEFEARLHAIHAFENAFGV